jgi:DHA2 family methylenomycin A resistance protein-like MFS transporter
MNANDKRMTLLATSISYVIVILDTSIVNVALANISQDLGTNVTGLQWIVNAYVVTFASLLLSGGALGDVFGARRTYIIGLTFFSVASLVSGCAPSMWVLIAGRILQGIGASLLVPCSLSMLAHAYPDSRERAKAIASWSSWGGAALVVGPLIGGFLLKFFDWRSIFLVNIPFTLVGIWLTLRTGRQVGGQSSRRLDIPGQSTAAITIILLTAALIEGSRLGTHNAWIRSAIVIAMLSAVAFVIIERKSKSPMLPLFLFSNPLFSTVAYMFLSGSAAFFGMLFVLSLYFQDFVGYTPLQTGIALLPLSVCVLAGNIISGKLLHRLTPLQLMLIGGVVRLVGFVGLAFVDIDFPYPVIATLLALVGFGGGLGAPMSTSIFMSTVDKPYMGIASGISRATAQIGSALGVAIFGAFIGDAHDMVFGTKMAALLAAILTGSIIVTNFYLLRQRTSVTAG